MSEGGEGVKPQKRTVLPEAGPSEMWESSKKGIKPSKQKWGEDIHDEVGRGVPGANIELAARKQGPKGEDFSMSFLREGPNPGESVDYHRDVESALDIEEELNNEIKNGKSSEASPKGK